MDKENLYYIIQRGTNQRERPANELWIGEKDVSEEKAKKLSFAFKIDQVPISIREYEEKFTDNDPEVKKEPVSYNLYSTGKHLLGTYNNKVIVINIEQSVVTGSITEPGVTSKIKEYLDEIKYEMNHTLDAFYILSGSRLINVDRIKLLNEEIEELIEKAI